MLLQNDQSYLEWVSQLKNRIQNAQLRASLAVNRELVLLYWHIGSEILDRQKAQGWGSKVIEQLAKDLKNAFPDMTGLSRTNLLYMRLFADSWRNEEFVQQAAGQIPWTHNCTILDKVKDQNLREWYIRRTIEHGWSRVVLVHQIESEAHNRFGNAQTNFSRTLPAIQSELARDILKDPYNFEFLGLSNEVKERDIEKGLIEKLRHFLIELGVGFAFVGSQYHLEVGGEDFYIDLLFYHIKLHCYVVIELKNTDFKPEYSGKLSFYISVVDDLVRDKSIDNPTIGIILCKGKNNTIAEYALRDVNKPIGVSTYHSLPLPKNISAYLPSVEELQKKLNEENENNNF